MLLTIININNELFDFDTFLSNKHTLFIKNCSNIKIFIKSKINKIIIINSNKIFLAIDSLICGIEISKTNNLIIYNNNNQIPTIELFRSNVYLYGSLENYKNTHLISEYSDLINIS